MKKTILLTVLLVFIPFLSFAGHINATTARKAAAAFFKSYGIVNADDHIVDVTGSTSFKQLYIFNLDNGNGFVIISADDNTEPVLAYSLSNSFSSTGIPPHVNAWLKGYEEAIICNASFSRPQAVEEQWSQLLSGNYPTVPKIIISPMISTTWNQSPYYNKYCPYDTVVNKRAPSGCTATATAQIMKYFNYPVRGYGSESYIHGSYGMQNANYGATTYLWDNMPDELTNNSDSLQVDAVAKLMYHIGVAVHMEYTPNGSGGKTASYGYGGEPSSENALKYNFRYSPYIWTAFRVDYTIDEWKELMLNEMKNGRPVLYAGYEDLLSGHAFIIDGYSSINDKFHFNWGWGGNCDGFYSLDNLNPRVSGHTYHFDLFATATIGIEPYDLFDTNSVTTVTTAVEPLRGASESDGVVTGAGTYNFGDTITLMATAANAHTRFVQWSDGCRYNPRGTVATGGELSFTAQFEPLQCDTIRYYTCNNALIRASNLPTGFGVDSVWGIKISADALLPHHDLRAVRFMGRKEANHTLTIYSGINSPEEIIYTATFYDTLEYAYSWYQYNLPEPLVIDAERSLWVSLKCTEVDTQGVFSIYGGNPNGMLSGENLVEMDSIWKFSWMIDVLFESDGTGIERPDMAESSLTLFPNPATKHVTLQGLTSDSYVEIIDMNGRLCKRFFLSANSSHDLDISDLSYGCYLMRVSDNNNSTVMKLVVK